MPLNWRDRAVEILLEGLQSRECLWNSSSKEYKDRNKKKTTLDELKELLEESNPELAGVDADQIKGKIQGLRTTFQRRT